MDGHISSAGSLREWRLFTFSFTLLFLLFVIVAGEYKESQEWFMPREVQDVRVVSKSCTAIHRQH